MSQPSPPATAPPQFTPNPDLNSPFYDPALPRDPSSLQQTLRPARGPQIICPRHLPPNLPTLTVPEGSPAPNPNKVLLVVPTANASKTALLTNHLTATKPADVTLLIRQIPAESGVGEQPYDVAGIRGAKNRAVAAARALRDSAEHRAALVEGGVGTVIVGAVENFVAREVHIHDGQREVKPVDYGEVVMCRIEVVREGETAAPWVWRVGESSGVTVPVEYWRAAEGFGFEDEARLHGKVTVGEVMAANLGVDKANWFEKLAGVSRYDLLDGALKNMVVPWPGVSDVEGL